jgi:hypothetical protein
MHTIGKRITLLSVSMTFALASFSQVTVNAASTAVPFLTVPTDTRSDGMGGVGIALSPDANGAQLNGAKMAFIQNDFGAGLSFTPWLKSLVNDIYLANFNAFYKIKDVQTIHTSLRFLSLGNSQYTSYGATQVHPDEFYLDAGYARKLSDIVSVDATVRFIYSNIAPDIGTNTEAVKPGLAGAVDLSAFVDKTWGEKGNSDRRHELTWGICISNIGNKMTYTTNVIKDFLPANLGIGFGYKLHFDPKDNNTLGIYADINKLLVPTPNQAVGGSALNPNGYEYSSHQANEGTFTGMYTSFFDAPGGANEEFKSIIEQVGAEYRLFRMYSFRVGYYTESEEKGGRQFMTVGTGVKYSFAALHFSYYIPVTSQHNPLDNTFSFALAFEFNKGILKKKRTSIS